MVLKPWVTHLYHLLTEWGALGRRWEAPSERSVGAQVGDHVARGARAQGTRQQGRAPPIVVPVKGYPGGFL